MKILIVNEENNNKKLNTYLLNNFKGLSLNVLYKALRKKDIKVNNVRINKNITIQTGDEIKIYIPDEFLYPANSFNIKDIIIYEDENIVIIDKPKNIEVLGDNSLTSILESHYNYIKPCHRLDRNTSGLIIFAKNQESEKILLQKFKNKEIIKEYHCLVYGIPTIKHKTVEDYLFKDSKKSLVYISNTPKKGYQKIITEYSILKTLKNNTSLLNIILHTGKTHQIRAHLAYMGYPIIGDGKYGNNNINKQFNKKTQCLNSYKITFNFKDSDSKLNYLNNKTFILKDDKF